MDGETVGQALHRWRKLRHLSLRQLGKFTNYSHVYVWEIETGRKPSQPDFIAACDRHLQAGGQLIALAANSRSSPPEADERELGLAFPIGWQEGIDSVTKLWRHDAGRRRFLRDAAFVSSAYAMPAQRWLALLKSDSASGPEGEPANAASVRAMTSMFRRLDNLYGSGQLRTAVAQYLDAEVGPILYHSSFGAVGTEFLSAVAELTQLAGWLAYDTCEHGLGQRYFIQALRLATEARDRALAAEILAGMSHQSIFLGQAAPAVDLAQAAHRAADHARVPALVAEASAMKAHALATLGKEKECVDALTKAETVFERADRADDPQWIGYLDEAYLAAISGHCFRALRQPVQAERFARRSLEMHPGYVRGRLFNKLLLAGSQVLKKEIDQACATGHEALDLASSVSSGRAVAQIDGLVRELRPWRADRRVKDLDERARLVTAQA